MKVVKEDLSKILARADITESTQWLSVKKRKGVFSYCFRHLSKDFRHRLYVVDSIEEWDEDTETWTRSTMKLSKARDAFGYCQLSQI